MSLSAAAHALSALLRDRDLRLVMAESCTGGRVAASLAAIPGISRWFCGSAVTYREATKVAWLDVDSELILRHSAVSREVSRSMALRVLAGTPEATVSIAVTGHLGPDAPPALDGRLFVAVAWREPGETRAETWEFRLRSSGRRERQREAAEIALTEATRFFHDLPIRE